MRGEIDEIVASVLERETPLTYFHELDDTYYTVTDDTYVGEIYSLLGRQVHARGLVALDPRQGPILFQQGPVDLLLRCL